MANITKVKIDVSKFFDALISTKNEKIRRAFADAAANMYRSNNSALEELQKSFRATFSDPVDFENPQSGNHSFVKEFTVSE